MLPVRQDGSVDITPLTAAYARNPAKGSEIALLATQLLAEFRVPPDMRLIEQELAVVTIETYAIECLFEGTKSTVYALGKRRVLHKAEQLQPGSSPSLPLAVLCVGIVAIIAFVLMR